MFKLIKMDLYRLFSTKAIKVGAIVACIMAAGYMLLSLGLVELVKFSLEQDPSVAESMADLFIPQVAWVGGVDFADIVIGGTGAFSLFVGCMIAASFIGSEQSCGYTKNFAGQLPNRGYMAVSKFVVTSVAQVIVLVIYAAVSAALVPVFLGKYVAGYSIAALLEALGLRLMLHIAVNAIIVFICTLTKSHAIAMVVGSIFGLGITQIAYWAASMVLSIAKINFDIGRYMPDGLNGQISIASIGTIYIKAIIVSVAFTAVFLIANYIVVSKRDVK